MSARVLVRFVELSVGIAGLVMLLILARAFGAIADGGMLQWAVTTDSPVQRTFAPGASIAWDHGLISVAQSPLGAGLGLAFQLAVLAFAIASLLALRGLVRRFAEGAFLLEENVVALRRIGRLLLASVALSILGALAVQPLLIASVTVPAGVALHPSLSWNVPGAENIWLDFEVPLGTLALSALAFLFASALQSGIAYRADSEGIL